MNTLSILIIEDEFPARKLLAGYIERVPGLMLLGSFSQPLEALPTLQFQNIGLLLLDINMPAMTGLDFLKTLPEMNRPSVVLTTAYAQYAVDAYELGVVDYLVKPIAFERFLQAINRVRAQRGALLTTEQTHALIRSNGKQYRMPYTDIQYVQGLRENVLVCTGTRQLIVHIGMREMELLLPAAQFVRVHKSYIVALQHVQFYEAMELVLHDGTRIPVGQTYKNQVDNFFS